jgi:hypothetical protein
MRRFFAAMAILAACGCRSGLATVDSPPATTYAEQTVWQAPQPGSVEAGESSPRGLEASSEPELTAAPPSTHTPLRDYLMAPVLMTYCFFYFCTPLGACMGPPP